MFNVSEIIEEGSSSSSHDDDDDNDKMVNISEYEEGSCSYDYYNNKRYEVFLSFRGVDLYDALVKADISTFLDNEEIETGEDLKPELEDAIRSSRASIIVLSKNFASSTWSLDELVLILERRRVFHHIVIPIFYDVEPTDVRKQQNSFGDAMREHRKKMKKERNAEKKAKSLTEVANLTGKQIMKDRREPDFIEEIVTKIRQRLGVPLSGTLPLLIGRYREIRELASWLTTDGSSSSHATAADILTVSGIGGIGKTSLAKYVFHFHSRTFAKSCFIEGINSTCTKNYDGLLDVQKQLSYVLPKKKKLRVKVFLVLDDIGSLKQLDALLGSKGFHPGSKILITTRDASLTERCALFKSKVDRKHTTLKIKGLCDISALELLRLHAFNCNDPKELFRLRNDPQEGYGEVIKKLMKYCEGHPLAIEVLGKSLYNRDRTYWEERIETLKNEPHSDIRTVLQLSFDSLPSNNDKELFKHIACFFVEIDREISEKVLKACDISTTSGITHLMERCLLSIDQRDNSLMMHQLLEEMGKAIVREESPDQPGERSRLWCHDESFKVLKMKRGTVRVKGLVLDKLMLEKEKYCDLETDAFSIMDKLMILHLNYVQLSGSYKKFPKELRWLHMRGFPFKSIPLDLQMEKLVVLDMSCSIIESFGTCSTSCNPQPLEGGQKVIGSCSKDKRILGSLKILDLSFCVQLHKLGGFYELPTLERLTVTNCISLIEIDELLEGCVELVHIDLSYCVKLEKLPTALHKLKKVKTLLLDGCNISSVVEKIPSVLNPCVISLPGSLVRLSLANNNLSNESFPVDFSCLSSLKYLCLDENPIVSMPNCVRSLCRLEELSLVNCKTLMSIEHPPCTLRLLMLWMYDFSSDIQRISFCSDMCPLRIKVYTNTLRPWSYEIEGMVKIQPLEGVEEKVLSSLGWTNLDFLNKRHVVTFHYGRGAEQSQIQMYYEFGIFSTIYGGQAMPDWIMSIIIQQNLGYKPQSKISFTIPSSPKKQLIGLNFCYVQSNKVYGELGFPNHVGFFKSPVIEMSNKTKNCTWIYRHCIEYFDVDGEWLTYLSHWMFGMNEMEAGDHIIITMKSEYGIDPLHIEKCGVSFVYEDEDGRMEDEEDALEYYKSWNHIIGGDLSSFQLTTGEYILYNKEFSRLDEGNPGIPLYRYSEYKEETFRFRAFSERKSPKIIHKGKVEGISEHRLPRGVQGVPPSQAHSFGRPTTSKLPIWDDDDCMMTENKEKEMEKSEEIKKRSYWWKMISCWV